MNCRILIGALDAPATRTVTVDYATANGTAMAGADYLAAAGTLRIYAGESEKTIEVVIQDDRAEDDGETFALILSNASGAVVADGPATGTKRNTESGGPEPEERSAPLSASFEAVPSEHDGHTVFAFRVLFSEPVPTSTFAQWF